MERNGVGSEDEGNEERKEEKSRGRKERREERGKIEK